METNDPLLKLYKNASFVDLYGGSILFTFVCSTLVFGSIIVAISNYIIDNTEKDWKSKRCQPPYNLLAGFIDKDKNKSFSQKTRENQEYCMKQVSSSSIQSIERPLKKAAQSIEVNQIKLNQHLDETQEKIQQDHEETQSFFERIQNIMHFASMETQKILAKLMDSLQKLTAVLTSSINVVSIIGEMFWKAIYFFKQLLIMIRNYTIGVITGLSLLLIGLFLSFQWIAAGFTGAFLALTSIFLMSIMLFIPAVTNTIETANMQMNSACFDGNTKVKTLQGINVSISDLQVGDVLEDESVVTATMKVPYYNKYRMVKIDNVIVTSDHRMVYQGNLIECGNCEIAQIIDNYEEKYLYCINTSYKTIPINNYIFLDWDDLSYNEYIEIDHNINRFTKSYMSFQNFFEKGFNDELYIECEDKMKQIKDLRIGDVTSRNEQILCVIDVLYSKDEMKHKHFITSTGTITINNNTYLDFDKEKEYYLRFNKDE